MEPLGTHDFSVLPGRRGRSAHLHAQWLAPTTPQAHPRTHSLTHTLTQADSPAAKDATAKLLAAAEGRVKELESKVMIIHWGWMMVVVVVVAEFWGVFWLAVWRFVCC